MTNLIFGLIMIMIGSVTMGLGVILIIVVGVFVNR